VGHQTYQKEVREATIKSRFRPVSIEASQHRHNETWRSQTLTNLMNNYLKQKRIGDDALLTAKMMSWR
jgi:hypothetical protein